MNNNIMDHWTPDTGNLGGEYGNFLFDDTDYMSFLGTNGVQENLESQLIPSLDTFDFGISNATEPEAYDNGFDSGYQSPPSNFTFEREESLNKINSHIAKDSCGNYQASLEPRSTNSVTEGDTPTIGKQENIQKAPSNLHSSCGTNNPILPTRKASVDSTSVNGEPSAISTAKIRRTRKRKTVSEEEREKKKKAFLARNREAARKCRIKKKSAHEDLQETHRTVMRQNSQLLAELAVLQAMKDEIKLELMAYHGIAEVVDEMAMIEDPSMQIQRPQMFKFDDSLHLVSISGAISSPISHQMSRSNSNASNFSHQPARISPNASNSHPMSRSSSNASDYFQKQFDISQMDISPIIPISRNDSIAPGSTEHYLLHHHDSASSTPSMARSGSQASGRDSGVENITPTTPQAYDPNLPGGEVIAMTPTQVKMEDAALVSGCSNKLSMPPQYHYRPMMNPGEYMRGLNISVPCFARGRG